MKLQTRKAYQTAQQGFSHMSDMTICFDGIFLLMGLNLLLQTTHIFMFYYNKIYKYDILYLQTISNDIAAQQFLIKLFCLMVFGRDEKI
ncbi:hypothetical protein ACJX0J_014864, partial [Zea mays]